MADKQITELTEATTITGVDLFVLEQDGTAKKLTGQKLLDFVTLSVVNVTVTTLPAGSQATAVYDKATGILSLGIPQGDKGETGDTGATGATPNIQIGEVTTLAAGNQATASITGTEEEPLLNLGIPKGATGNTGPRGATGTRGSRWFVQTRNPIIVGENVLPDDFWSNSNGYVYKAQYNTDGELQFVSTGLTIKGSRGDTGADGITPHIGDNGNWFLGDTDTGIAAAGDEWELIASGELAEAAALTINRDADGNPFSLKSAQIIVSGATSFVQSTMLRFEVDNWTDTYNLQEWAVEYTNTAANDPNINAVYIAEQNKIPTLYIESPASDLNWGTNISKVQAAKKRVKADNVSTYSFGPLTTTINRIYVGNYMGNGTLGAGCKYQIWGVRA